MRRPIRLLAALLAAASLVSAAAPVLAADPATGTRPGGDDVARSGAVAPAGRVVRLRAAISGTLVNVGGIRVEVPAPGHGVGAAGRTTAGGEVSVRVENRPGAGVTARTFRREPRTSSAAGVSPAAVLDECKNGHYAVGPAKWRKTFTWRFTPTGKPSYLATSKIVAAFGSSVRSITSGRNTCGRPDRISATSSYKGTTSRSTGINTRADCRSDGASVVGFVRLPGSLAGLTCWWYYGHTTVEADMALSTRLRWTTTLKNCSNEYLIQEVATHEFGHVFGLEHVSRAADANLTMYVEGGPCENGAFTLGLGDLKGLEVLY